MIDQQITLPDGRQLGYASYGAVAGWPVLYFHGTPSSRLEVKFLETHNIALEEYLSAANLRLIAVDRPGMGTSSFHAGKTYLSFATDVSFLLQSLQLSHCSLLCWSGGGPYALAMAWQFPEFIKDVYILCGFSQPFTKKVIRQMKLNKWYFRAAKYTPSLLRFVMNRVRNSKGSYALPQWLTGLPDVDYNFIRKPSHFQIFAALTVKQACRNGARGPVQEAALYYHKFGFSLSDIQQPVHFWWGTKDTAVIQLHAEAVAQHIKNSTLHYKGGEGHLSVYVRYFKEALQIIAAQV